LTGFFQYKNEFIPKYLPVPQINYVKFVTSVIPESRRFKILKKNNLLFNPWTPIDYRLKGKKADFILYCNKIENSLPSSPLAKKYQTSYEGYACFYRAIQFYWKGYEKPFTKHQILHMRWNFLMDPAKYCEALKQLFNSLRAQVLTKIDRPDNILDFYFSGKVSALNKLQASACIRALPRFLGNTDSYIQDCIRRWVQPRPRPDLTEWKEWISSWVKFNRPKRFPDFFPISLGSTACLEFSRQEGGLKQAVKELMRVTLSKERGSSFDSDIKKIQMKSLFSVDVTPYRRTLHLIYACLTVLEPAIKHSKVCDGCDKPSLHPPMCILALRERGFKVRLPTMTLSSIVILGKILRQVADGYLRSDPRIRNSLEGNFLHELSFKSSKLWRSQDLTVATDYHHVEMTRSFYRLINPGVTWWEDAVSVVCNYYTIFSEDSLVTYRLLKKSLQPWAIEDLPIFHVKGYFQDLIRKSPLKPSPEAISDLHWNNVHSRHGRVTCQGQPMGVPTSWPLLPLVSIFCFEKSSTKKLITISRKVYATLDSFDRVNMSLIMDGKQKTILLERKVPSNWLEIQTTGDDAIMNIGKKQSLEHTRRLESLGSIVSPTKDFLSKRYAIYTEIFYDRGKCMPVWPVGPLLAPESTRQCTWYSQPKALRIIENNFKVRIPFKKSKFYYHWKFLADLGCPIWAPEPLGGLNIYLNYPQGVKRLGKGIRFLLYEELETVLHLSKDLPLKNLYKLGMIERPARSGTDKSVSIMQSLTFERKKTDYSAVGLSIDSLSEKSTVTSPSPEIIMPLEVWDQVYRSQFTWEQLYATDKLDPEPSLLNYIHRFDFIDPYLTLKRLNELYEEYIREDKTIKVPWGLYETLKPLFGLLLPRTSSPIFYYYNRSLDYRTSVIEF